VLIKAKIPKSWLILVITIMISILTIGSLSVGLFWMHTYQTTLQNIIISQQEDLNVQQIILNNIKEELEKTSFANEGRFLKMECQVDLAAAGFRMGHSRAYIMMTTGAFKSCTDHQENYTTSYLD
jgi:cell division protein YceG involved in septum cleavage